MDLHTSPVFHLLGASQAYNLGVILGQVFAVGLLAVFLVRAVLLLWRPSAHKACVTALILVLGALLANFAAQKILALASAPDWSIYIVRVGVLLLLSLALLTAFVGLATLQKKHDRGRAHAIWAMVLAVLTITGNSFVLVRDLAAEIQKESQLVRSDGSRPGHSEREAAFEKHNFEITLPGKSWVALDPKRIQEEACLVYRDTPNDIYLAVIAEQQPTMSEEATGLLAEVVKSNMSSKSTVLDQTEETLKLRGQEFVHLRSRIENSKLVKGAIVFDQWVLARNGFAWQLNIWGPQAKEAEVYRQGRLIAESFQIRDLDKRASTPDHLTDVERPELGYSAKLSGRGWMNWPEGKDSTLPAMADFGVTNGGSCILVMPYRTESGDPPALDALARAYLANLEFAYRRSDTDYATRPLETPFAGLEVATEREVDGRRFKYLFRVYQSGPMSWLVAGWYLASDKSGLERLRAGFDQVQLFQPAGERKWKRTDHTQALAREQTEFQNELGLWYYEKREWLRSERHFRAAALSDPRNYTYLENASRAIEQQERAAEALEFLEKAPSVSLHAVHEEYRIRQSWLRLKSGETELALEQLLGLIRHGFQDNDEILDHINEYLDQDKVEEARRLADAYALAKPEPRPRLWRAEVTKRAGDEEGALKQMEALSKDEPDYMEGRYSYGEMANNLGRHDIALTVADALAKEGADTARLHVMRGWAHMGRKWYKDAKASFEKAAAINPDDEDAKYGLEEASASLGQGSNSEIKTPLEPVALPAELRERLAKVRAAEPEFGHGASAAFLLRATCTFFRPTEPMRTTIHRVVRIFNEEGAESFSSVRYSFDPLIEQFYVNRVEVRDESGAVVSRAAVDDAYVLDDQEDITTTGSKAVHIQVPGLKPGFTVEIEVTTQRFSKRDTLPLQREVFAGETPTLLEALYIHGDVKDLKYKVARAENLQVKTDENSLLFQVSPSLTVPYEDFTQPTEKFAASLVLGGSKQTWAELGRDYIKDLEDRLKPDPRIEDEARRLTADLTDTRAKVRVLAAFVQKSVRYKAIEFGVRGVIPNPPRQTLEQRFGDCKDQSTLLYHLLRASGVTAHLALIDTSWELPLEPPSMDHFNHMVVYVPDLEKTLIVDPTQAYLAIADYVPDWLTGKQAFVLEEGNPRFIQVPKPQAGDVLVSVKRRLSAAGTNDVRVVEETTFRGAYASSIRSSYARHEPRQRFQHTQELLDANGNYRLEDYELLNFEDPTLPTVLKLTYLAPNAIIQRPSQTRLHLPDPWEARFLRLQYLKERVTPFRWSKPFTMTSEVVLDPALGVTPESIQAMAGGGKTNYGLWRMGPPSKPNAEEPPSLKFAFSCNAGDFPASEYKAFQTHWTSALDSWNRELDLVAKAAGSPTTEPAPEKKIAAPAPP